MTEATANDKEKLGEKRLALFRADGSQYLGMGHIMRCLAFAHTIYDHFQNDTFTWREVLHLLEIHAEWLEINRHVQQKVVP